MKLGQRVQINAVMESGWVHNPNPRPGEVAARGVKRRELPSPLTGVIAGVRTLKEGWTDRGYYGEDGPVFHQTNAVRVYLVAVNLARTVYAAPEDVEIEEGEQ